MWQRARFLIARLNGRKIPIYIIIVAFLIWLFLPTGDPSDVLITLPLLKILGFKVFIAIAVILLIIFFSNRKIRNMMKKPTSSEVERICHKISKTKSSFKDCVNSNG